VLCNRLFDSLPARVYDHTSATDLLAIHASQLCHEQHQNHMYTEVKAHRMAVCNIVSGCGREGCNVSLLNQSGSSSLKPTLCSHQAVGMVPQHSHVVLAALACSTYGPHARPSISSLMHAPRCLEFVLKTMVDSFAGRACRALHSTQGPSGRRMPAPPPNYMAASGAAGLAAGMSVHKAAAVRAAASKYR